MRADREQLSALSKDEKVAVERHDRWVQCALAHLFESKDQRIGRTLVQLAARISDARPGGDFTHCLLDDLQAVLGARVTATAVKAVSTAHDAKNPPKSYAAVLRPGPSPVSGGPAPAAAAVSGAAAPSRPVPVPTAAPAPPPTRAPPASIGRAGPVPPAAGRGRGRK
jgi:hypothetical protein